MAICGKPYSTPRSFLRIEADSGMHGYSPRTTVPSTVTTVFTEFAM